MGLGQFDLGPYIGEDPMAEINRGGIDGLDFKMEK